MQNKGLLIKEVGLFALLSGIAYLVLRRLVSSGGSAGRDKPIVISGGSMYVSSRGGFQSDDQKGRLTVNLAGHSATQIDVVTDGVPMNSISVPAGSAWSIVLTTPMISVSSDGLSPLVTIVTPAPLPQVFYNPYIADIRLQSSGALMAGAVTVGGAATSFSSSTSTWYFVVHYQSAS